MTPGRQALDATLDLLRRFKDAPIEIEERESSLVITPTGADTFPVTIYDQGEEAMISADRWHTHYDDPEQAAFCVMWLLTPFYRLVHELRAGVLVATWIERYEATGWEGFEPVFFLNPDDEPSWRGGPGIFRRRYLQQSVLPSPQPYEEICPGAVLGTDGLPLDFKAGSFVEDVDSALGPLL